MKKKDMLDQFIKDHLNKPLIGVIGGERGRLRLIAVGDRHYMLSNNPECDGAVCDFEYKGEFRYSWVLDSQGDLDEFMGYYDDIIAAEPKLTRI